MSLERPHLEPKFKTYVFLHFYASRIHSSSLPAKTETFFASQPVGHPSAILAPFGYVAPCYRQCCTAQSIGLTQSSESAMNTSAGNLAAPGVMPVFIRASVANTSSSLVEVHAPNPVKDANGVRITKPRAIAKALGAFGGGASCVTLGSRKTHVMRGWTPSQILPWLRKAESGSALMFPLAPLLT